MDGEESTGWLGWLIDLAAAVIAGGAIAYCFVLIGEPAAAVSAGAGTLLLSFSLLQCVRPESGRYRLPAIELPDWSAVLSLEVLELTEVESAPPPAAEASVIRLFPMTRLPTPGELKTRIDAHLDSRAAGEDDNVVLLSPDASAALTTALAQLKRSLG